uniref:Ubiquitin carboxyl-terminal hydrolase n=1 Tax=Arcella intermedia TaxID=1963864 RepID=A0A6B2KXK6_9EUKA
MVYKLEPMCYTTITHGDCLKKNSGCWKTLKEEKFNPLNPVGFVRKKKEVKIDFGEDPKSMLRVDEKPVGLMNLGATCYMNSLLQCLYSIPLFRSVLFECSTETTENDAPLNCLKILFAHMQMGMQKHVTPIEFAFALQLDVGTQQDPQEFYQLLLSYLENRWKAVDNKELNQAMTTLFSGKLKYLTSCDACKEEFSTTSDWNQLSLHIDEKTTLSASIDNYLLSEEIHDYICEKCAAPRTVKRKAIITSLPSVINVHLLRFIFNKGQGQKIKLMNNITYPLEMDFGQYVENKEPAMYELFAVIFHVGESANVGHYVAHIKEGNNWWLIDDSTITSLKEAKGHSERNKTAYMLFYRLKSISKNIPAVPKEIADEVDKETAQLFSSLETFEVKKNEKTNKMKEDQSTRKKIKKCLSPPSSGGYNWINADWLKRWLNNPSFSEKIENKSIMCPHDAVTTDLTKIRRISKEAWTQLNNHYTSDRELNDSNVCFICVLEKKKFSREKEKVKSQVSISYYKPSPYRMSKSWYQRWCNSSREEMETCKTSFTNGILCEHGNLSDDVLDIPEEVFNYFNEKYPHPENIKCMESTKCPWCKEKQHVIQTEKSIRDQERYKLYNFNRVLEDPTALNTRAPKFYLVSSVWAKKWQIWLQDVSYDHPGEISNSEDLLCEHKKLKYQVLGISLVDRKLPFVVVSAYVWGELRGRFPKGYPISLDINLLEANQIIIAETDPAVCEECITKREQMEADKLVHFQNRSLQIIEKNFADTIKRSGTIECSFDTTIEEVQLKVMASFDIPPEEQNLWFKNTHLSDPKKTLKDYKVTPNQPIEIAKSQKYLPFEEERGFKGSLLTGQTQTPEQLQSTSPRKNT